MRRTIATSKQRTPSYMFEVEYTQGLCPVRLVTRVRAGCLESALRHVEARIPGAACLACTTHRIH